jgi:hypothetical protein
VSAPPERAWWCAHEQTTAPDANGFVICLACLTAIHKPEPLNELIKRIRR